MPVLKANKLQKSYNGRHVVKRVSITINLKQIVGLLGPNGAGKTTSFYMMVGLITPDQGEVYLDDKNISRVAIHKRARLGIGYLPQESSIFQKLTVAENIQAILELRNGLSLKGRQEKLEELLQEFDIAHVRHTKGFSLSGGERRRVEIARALAIEPKFILLDEPFAGIDPISVVEIKRIIIHLRDRGIGVLITDHNVRATLDICQKAYIMSEGRMIASGTPQNILDNADVREVYLGDEFIW